jgi:hypothetical protein
LYNVFSITFLVLVIGFSSQLSAQDVVKTSQQIKIDGIANEPIWQQVSWHPIDQAIIGDLPKASDFSAQYKLTWDESYLYILVEIVDDKLYDGHPIPTEFYWDDDCLEIFIDEDASGGLHQFNFNAFAYHLALDNQVVDIGEKDSKGEPQFLVLNEHARNRWRRSIHEPHKIIWEVALIVYNDDFKYEPLAESSDTVQSRTVVSQPVSLSKDKTMGFMLAYCDNDGSKHRESFVGSHPIQPVNGDKNRGYIDASVFGIIKLIDKK